MLNKIIDHAYIVSTILLTVYSQLIMRWRVQLAGPLPAPISEQFSYIAKLLLNPWVLSGVMATFLAGVSWMLTMTKFEINYAYPWVSLNFVLMLLLGVMFFNESFNTAKVLGTLLVMSGIVVIARS